MSIPADLKYTAEHEWVRLEDGRAVVGITAFAQNQLGDVVYVELPAVGSRLKAGSAFGVVESVKAVSDLFSPISAEVLEVNERLNDEPELVNDEPYGEGWMVVLSLDGAEGVEALLDAEAYAQITAEG
ncbi:MAG: glycine cleavage system protein GcvH [Caldilineae bacterium]|nr:glycine cleavage system protein GcvH [Chloroflexota bacterium]MCB9177557.1 glycine cleavage system protein GcvH [Caldilineae bacterium]